MQVADLEYRYAVDELNSLLGGGRVSKAYQITSALFKIVFASREGKHTLIFQLPDYATLTKRDIPSPQQPSNFTMALRKRVENAIVTGVEQPGFERIIIFNLDVKGDECRLIIELFSNGNIIFCGHEGMIDLIYRSESWRERELRKGVSYKLPPSKISPLNMDESMAGLNGKKTLMAGLLSVISLSPKYLEEALVRAGVDPKSKEEPSAEERVRIVEAVRAVCSEGRFYVYKKEGTNVDYSVCALSKYGEGYEREEFTSVLEMIDAFYEPVLHTAEDVVDVKGEVALQKMKERLAELEGEASFYKGAGDWIYERYAEIEALVASIRQWKKEGRSNEEINMMVSQINPTASFVNGALKFRIR